MKRTIRPISEWTLEELEDLAIYIGLGLLVSLEFLSNVLPAVQTVVGPSSVPTYALGLLALRLLVKKLIRLERRFAPPDAELGDFNQNVRHLFRDHPRPHRIDILATNTRKFYHAIEDLAFYADEIRILLYENTPGLDTIAARWKLWHEQGRCGRLLMRTYPYTPTFYGMCIDRQDGAFGFFDPDYMADPTAPAGPMQVSGPHLVSRDSPVTRDILDDVQRWFDVTFQYHSHELLSCPSATG